MGWDEITYLWAGRFACSVLACLLNVIGVLVIYRSKYRLLDSLPIKYVLAITICQLVSNSLTLAISVLGVTGHIKYFNTGTWLDDFRPALRDDSGPFRVHARCRRSSVRLIHDGKQTTKSDGPVFGVHAHIRLAKGTRSKANS